MSISIPDKFIIEKGILKKYTGPGGDVIVPDGVERIEQRAFYKCRELISIRLPEGLKTIGTRAFYGCDNLMNVVFPKSLISVESWAFSYCFNLKSIILPNGMERIEAFVFKGCWEMKKARLPENLKDIGECAFQNCNALTNIRLPNSIQRIGVKAFYCCFELDASIPASLIELGSKAFYGCRKLQGPLPTGLTRFGSGAFSGCAGLADKDGFVMFKDTLYSYTGTARHVVIPENVTHIGSFAFEGRLCVHIPESVTEIDDDAFWGSDLVIYIRQWIPPLTKALNTSWVYVAAIITENENLVPDQFKNALRIGSALKKDPDLYCEGAKETLVWLSKNAGSIMDAAFYFPDILQFLCDHRLIKPNALEAYLAGASMRWKGYNSQELTEILLSYQEQISASEKNFRDPNSERGFLQENDMVKKNIGSGNNDVLISGSEFLLENGVLKLYTGSGGDVVVPECVTEIGEKAFFECRNIRSVLIPDSVTYIGDRAFAFCSDLLSVTLPQRVDLGECVFTNCSSLTSITLPDNTSVIGTYAFEGCVNLKSITIPDGVWSIRKRAFYQCRSIQSVSIPDSVIEICDYAFGECSGLLSVSIPDSVTHIGERAFWRCSNLFEVSLPQRGELGKAAFADCSSLTSVTYPSQGCRGTNIAFEAFCNCSSLTSVMLPDNTWLIGERAFLGCVNLKNVTIPDSVTRICEYAFCDCRELEYIEIPNPDCLIENAAFCDSGLREAKIPLRYGPRSNWEDMGVYSSGMFKSCKDLRRLHFITEPGDSCILTNSHAFDDTALKAVLAPMCSIDSLPAKIKLPAVVGFTELVSQGYDFDIEIRSSYENYIRKRKKVLYPYAVHNTCLLHYLFKEKLIPKRHMDELFTLAEQENSEEAKEVLLEYRDLGGK